MFANTDCISSVQQVSLLLCTTQNLGFSNLTLKRAAQVTKPLVTKMILVT
jgi:hypothetical protein